MCTTQRDVREYVRADRFRVYTQPELRAYFNSLPKAEGRDSVATVCRAVGSLASEGLGFNWNEERGVGEYSWAQELKKSELVPKSEEKPLVSSRFQIQEILKQQELVWGKEDSRWCEVLAALHVGIGHAEYSKLGISSRAR